MIKRILIIIGAILAGLATLNFGFVAFICWFKAHDAIIIRTGTTGDWYTLMAMMAAICLASAYTTFWLVSLLRRKPKPPADTHF